MDHPAQVVFRVVYWGHSILEKYKGLPGTTEITTYCRYWDFESAANASRAKISQGYNSFVQMEQRKGW